MPDIEGGFMSDLGRGWNVSHDGSSEMVACPVLWQPRHNVPSSCVKDSTGSEECGAARGDGP